MRKGVLTRPWDQRVIPLTPVIRNCLDSIMAFKCALHRMGTLPTGCGTEGSQPKSWDRFMHLGWIISGWKDHFPDFCLLQGHRSCLSHCHISLPAADVIMETRIERWTRTGQRQKLPVASTYLLIWRDAGEVRLAGAVPVNSYGSVYMAWAEDPGGLNECHQMSGSCLAWVLGIYLVLPSRPSFSSTHVHSAYFFS